MNAQQTFGNEAHWVNINVDCETCGVSVVAYLIKDLIDLKPEFECPICEEPTGQRTTVETQ